MTSRERWYNTYHYLPVDHVPDIEFGYWGETFPVWHEQGLPREITNIPLADRYFGFEGAAEAPANLGLSPAFETKVLEEGEGWQVIVNGDGVTCKIRTDGDSLPHFLDWTLKTPQDWEQFKARLDPEDPSRYAVDWEATAQALRGSEVPVTISCGSLFGWLRDWMGFQNIAIACMDQPEWIEEMIEHLTVLFVTVLERTLENLPGVRIDAGAFWEDMAFKQGPIISPKLFRQWLTPRYKRITDVVKRAGADVFLVDCDGNIMGIAEHFLAGGVNCMFPLEIACDTSPERLRKLYGRDMLLQGGVNKRELARDKAAIRREVDRVAAVVAEGGYIPHVDHRCPPDVSYDNYLYYLKTKREALGMPDPWADGPPDTTGWR